MNRLLSCFVVLAFVLPARSQVVPEKALATFKTSPGLEVTLWAAEPLCVNPTCMDIDHKGRVWYCESINYRQKLRGEKKMRRPEGDCIVILEDTKGDGKADKRTIFYQAPEIHAPLGIAVAPYPDGKGVRVYVCQSPDILVFEDKDGDGKADGPPTKLLSGFGGYDHDHGVHGILIGPDNKLYFTVGDTGVRDLQSSDKKGRKWTSNNTDCQAATVWRCDLDGKNLELIAHNFRNNYEACVDSFGTVFLSDNDDDGQDMTRICYVMPGGNYGYHRNPKTSHWNEEHPGIVPKILRTYRGSPTGICMYEGTLLPKEYRGQILHTDAGPGRLSCYHLTPKGASFAVEREDMLTSTDSWFRPSDVTVAPDGSVFVCDWYDPGVGGHGVGDFTRGRIYRVAPKGSTAGVAQEVEMNAKGISAALGSPNLAIRAWAMANLESVPKSDLSDRLKPALQSDDATLRARAFWQLSRRLEFGINNLLARVYQDNDPRFRLFALRAEKTFLNNFPHRLIAQVNTRWAEDVLKDSSAAVRREALLLLQEADPSKSKEAIYALAKQYDGKDRFYLAAIGIAVGAPGISKEIDARREIILADFEKHFPEWNDKVAGLIWELRPPGVIPLLQKQLADGKLPAQQKLQVVEMLAASGDAKAGLDILKALPGEKSDEVRQSIVHHLQDGLAGRWSGLRQAPELKNIVTTLLGDAGRRPEAFALISAAKDRDFLNHAVKAPMNEKDLLETRRQAIRTLGAFPDLEVSRALSIFVHLQEKPLPEELRVEAVNALGKQGTAAARERLGALVQEPNEFPLPVRQAAAAALAGHKTGGEMLLKMYTDKQLNADLTSDLARLLRNSPFPEIKKEAQSMLPAPPKLDPKKLPSIPALATRKGNLLRGEQLMAKTLKNDAACLKCHTIQGVGGNVGPDLSSIGAKASRENLLESILYPSKAINHQYDTWIVETNDGLVITGIIGQETPDQLVLRDANVKEFKVKIRDIASKKKSPISIMPDNLMLHISEDDLLDLVEYLYSLKNPPIGASSRITSSRMIAALRDECWEYLGRKGVPFFRELHLS